MVADRTRKGLLQNSFTCLSTDVRPVNEYTTILLHTTMNMNKTKKQFIFIFKRFVRSWKMTVSAFY